MAPTDAGELERAAAFRSELRRFLSRVEAVAARADLTPQRYDLLLQLEAAGELTVTELGRRLHLRQTAVTELVKRAEDAGLVTRRRSTEDRRVHLLGLTSEGEHRLERAFVALSNDRAALVHAFDELGASFHASEPAGRAHV